MTILAEGSGASAFQLAPLFDISIRDRPWMRAAGESLNFQIEALPDKVLLDIS